MPVVHQFAYGPVTAVIALLMSFLGAVLGLTCAARARTAATEGRRARWLVLGSLGIGATSVWLMQFMAMLGFDVPTRAVRYDVPLTAASLLIAIAATTAGVFLASSGRPSLIKILCGGLVVGAGAAGAHYTGTAALEFGGRIAYNPDLVLISLGAAVLTSIVAVWCAMTARKWKAVALASLILAAGYSAMHYIGMAAMRVLDLDAAAPRSRGVDPILLVAPITVIATTTMMGLLFGALSMMTDEEFAASIDMDVLAVPFKAQPHRIRRAASRIPAPPYAHRNAASRMPEACDPSGIGAERF
jgi:NO-binding membrane sensor protein with MHYT domain